MKNLRVALFSLAWLLTISCQTPAIQSAPGGSRWVMGYYVGYLVDRQPVDAIDWSGLTHLAVGIFLPKNDGALDSSIAPDAVARARLIQAAHDHGVKAIAMIGGADTGLQWFEASSDANRANFIANLKKSMALEGFDGLDLDWEPLETSHQPRLLKLTQELRAALPKAVLTFPADGADNANFPADRSFFASLAPYLDQLNLMTYGMAGSYSGWKTWHSSPLYHQDSATPTSIDFTVTGYLKAGIPAAKLGLGIGFYGLCYGPPATGPLEDTVGRRPDGSSLLASDNDISYANIVTQYAPLGTRHWDANARVPYVSFTQPSGPKGCTYISYDDPESILEKGRYAKAKGLGGAIIWNINEGYIAGGTPANPLLDASRRAFLERP